MIARYIGLGLLVCATCTGLQAQQKLVDLVSEANAEWMFGKWETQTDSGSVTLDVSWDLAKHVVVLHVKTPDMELKGYSALDPTSTMDVSFYGFDDRGTISKGKWALEDGKLVLRIESQTAERTVKMAAVFAGNSTDGLLVSLHGVDQYGSLAPARSEVRFKKVK